MYNLKSYLVLLIDYVTHFLEVQSQERSVILQEKTHSTQIGLVRNLVFRARRISHLPPAPRLEQGNKSTAHL